MVKSVIVVFGGVSNENEISVITGVMAANVLKERGLDVMPVYISQQNKFYCGVQLLKIGAFADDGYLKCPNCIIADGGLYILKRGKPKRHIVYDCLLNCCHGGYGEGGGMCGVCAAAGLPLAGENIFPSAAFMDKNFTKILLKGLGVDTLPYTLVTPNCKDVCGFDFPVIVKPANLGSSIGVTVAHGKNGLAEALNCAFAYDSAAIVEKYISDRREINCAAYYSGGVAHVTECEEAVSGGDILSYGDKYEGGGKSIFPARLPAEISQKIRQTTLDVYTKLGMRGIVRFDYILSGERVYLSEVNTVPGSLACYLIAKGFKNFGAVLEEIITEAAADYNNSGKKLLKTGILKNIPQGYLQNGGKTIVKQPR